MTKRILSIVLALLMAINVFTIAAFAEESDNHASWKLTCSNASPAAGDTLNVDVYLEADYVTNIFGALIVYDKTYYEPAEAKEGDNFVIASDIADYGNKTVVMSEKKSATIADKLYDASYTAEMKEQYGIAWFSFTFQASKFDDPTSDLIPSFASMTKVATLKLKVKSSAPSDGNGLIWMDPVYIQTANGSAKYTFVSRGTNEVIGQCLTAAKYGQSIDVSEAVLYKAEEVQCSHNDTTVINAVEATCTQAGYTGDTYCNDCQQIIAQGTVINALNHNFTSQTKSATYLASAATCTADATYYYKCSRCTEKDTTNTWTDAGSKLDHVFTSQTKSAEYLASPASCTTDATYYYKCENCTEKDTTNTWTDANSATGHTPGQWQVITPATCVAQGLKAKYCTVCSQLLEQENIGVVDHTVVVDAAVPATCLATGLTEGSHCSVCNTVLVAQEPTPLGDHTWGDWYEVTPATTTTVGLERHECTVCHTTQDRDIPMIVIAKADYSAVNAALANVPADLSVYTTATVQALNAAIQAVVYDLPETEQETVNGYAADIQTAINNLRLIPTNPANYADLDDYIAKYVPATSNRTNGVYDAEELAQIDALIASFDRELSSDEQDTVDGYLAALRVAVAALTIDETKAVASFAVTTDKDTANKDDIITVSLKLKTNYPIYTMQVPIIYDATVFQIVTPNASVPKSYLTYTGSLANAYKLDGNHNPASSMYKRNSNPSYWSNQTQYKVAYATWAYDVSINNIPVTLEDQEVIATFQLKVITDNADVEGSIFLNSDWIKTATTKGGALAVGRTQGSVISVLEGTKYEIGQTFDLADATATVVINSSHVHTPGAWAVEEDKYVLRCTDCNEIIESKDLPLAQIASVVNDGTIEEGASTVITVDADALVAKVRLVNAAGGGEGSVITTETTDSGKTFTMTRAFSFTGSERVITVQYKLGNTWLDAGTINVNVVRTALPSAEITSITGTGVIEPGTQTVIKVTPTAGTVLQKARIMNASGNSVSATTTVDGSSLILTTTFLNSTEQTFTVQFKADGVWYDIEGSQFTVKAYKEPVPVSASIESITGTGIIEPGTQTVIKITPADGTVLQKARIMNSSGNSVSATTTVDGNSLILTTTFMNSTEQTFYVQFKANGTWYDVSDSEFTVRAYKEPVPVSATVTEISGVGVIEPGTQTVIKITPAEGTVLQKARIMNYDGNSVAATTTVDGNSLILTTTFMNSTEKSFFVQFKANGTWYDIADSEFTVKAYKEPVPVSATITEIQGTGTIAAGTPTVIKVTPGEATTIQKVRIMNSDGNSVSATTTVDGDSFVLTATFLNTTEKTFTVQFKADGVWYDIPDSAFVVQAVK